jgi:hypothetical protein
MASAAPLFSGFSNPNYTMVPDQLFDELMPDLSGAELKVLLYIIRRTFGFKRDADAISISQLLAGITTADGRILDRGVGLSKPALLAALRSLSAQRIIIVERRRSLTRGNEPTVYRLNIGTAHKENAPQQQANSTPLVKKVDTPLVKKVDTQYTGIQETEYSNIRKRELGVKKDVKTDDPYAETTIVIVEEPVEQAAEGSAQDHTPSHTAAPVVIGDLLAQHPAQQAGKGDTPREVITQRIAQFAEEFGDRASLKSSSSRAYNVYRQAGVSVERFVASLWEARAITRDRVRAGGGVNSKMGYFFTVLSERLGIDSLTRSVLPAERMGSA